MAEDVHKVGKKVINEVVEVDKMAVEVEAIGNHARKYIVKRI